MIRLERITIGYDKRVLLEDASCCMSRSRLVALVGRNGAGKSTLLRTIAGLAKPIAGRVLIDGCDIQQLTAPERAKKVALVTTGRIRVSNMLCRDLVAMGRAPYTNWIGRMRREDRDIVERSLAMTGMSAYADRPIDTLSDGECQRVMIARALAQDTPVMLLDEPTSFLDLPNRYELCSLLRSLAHESGKCILFSTHELDIALRRCDDVALIDSPGLQVAPASDPALRERIKVLFNLTNDYI